MHPVIVNRMPQASVLTSCTKGLIERALEQKTKFNVNDQIGKGKNCFATIIHPVTNQVAMAKRLIGPDST